MTARKQLGTRARERLGMTASSSEWTEASNPLPIPPEPTRVIPSAARDLSGSMRWRFLAFGSE
jgi:hypothetical protein